ncbi:MAG: hypothetical protein AAB496_00945 [Patescibacteria group bacterium]
MSEFYVDERQRAKRRRVLKFKIYGAIAVFFILLASVFYLIVYSPLFQIKNILMLTTSDVVNLNDLKDFFTNQSKISSFLGADNILIWKGDELNRFLKNQPRLLKLTIEKKYFKREIVLTAKEREKFGIWCQLSGDCWWFDKEGIIFDKAPQVEGEIIYKVKDFSERKLDINSRAIDEMLFNNLFKIFEVLDKSGLGIKTLRLNEMNLEEVISESPLAPKIYFSLRTNPFFGLSVLQSLKNFGLGKIEYIDLRVENRGYYKLK